MVAIDPRIEELYEANQNWQTKSTGTTRARVKQRNSLFTQQKRNMGMSTNDELYIFLMSERECIATNFPTSNRNMREQPARENFIFALERQ